MIEIREDQFRQFVDRMRSNFVGRVVAYLKENQKSAVSSFSKEDLMAMIQRQIEVAERHGIRMEAGVVKFIEVGLRHGEDFHSSGRYPEVEAILLEELDEMTKVEALAAAVEGSDSDGAA